MKKPAEIAAARRPVERKKLLLTPSSSGGADLVDESAIVVEDGEPVIAYLELDKNLPEIRAMREALPRIEYQKSFRTGGLPTVSRIFGFSPRETLRKDFCSATALAKEAPAEHLAVCEAGKLASRMYREFHPDLFYAHSALTKEKVREEWVIPGTPFTSGIINLNNQLMYHLDSGNFREVWSAMFVFKRDVEGGHLSVPEYGLEFELKDASLLLFDGQSLVHGVTPITKTSPYGYRYSVVYYSLRQMWNCLSVKEELSRIRMLRAQREKKRAAKKP